MKLRTFIALELPEIHKQDILQYLNVWSKLHKNGITWVKPENLHLTLLFIGETQNADLPELSKALFDVMLKTSGFELKCLGFELFPAKAPRLLWVKLDTQDRAIFQLAKDLNKAVRDFGCEPDAKSLKLHITVGRIKSPQPAWLEQEFMQSQLLQATALYDTVTFYQSVLKQDGPVYTAIQQFNMIK